MLLALPCLAVLFACVVCAFLSSFDFFCLSLYEMVVEPGFPLDFVYGLVSLCGLCLSVLSVSPICLSGPSVHLDDVYLCLHIDMVLKCKVLVFLRCSYQT